MTDHNDDLKPLAIEGKLPLKAVGIENLKEANPQHMPPHRYLHPWFARRPTPASRLAILASVMPADTDSDELLELMQIGPESGLDSNISKYVEQKKSSEDDRSGTLQEHYGYPRPFTRSPSPDEVENLHKTLRDRWNGRVPTVFDPTAGGGVIPYEALRYGLPTTANELNPVPTLILKVMLEYAPKAGSLKQEIDKWASEIDQTAESQLEEFFPSVRPSQTPSHYPCTYTVDCPECGCDIPLVKKWWLRKGSASKGVAAKPTVTDSGTVSYECVTLPDDITKEEFNPQDGPHSTGGAECLNCGVVMESDKIRSRFHDGEFDYEIYGVKYTKEGGGSGFRAPTQEDQEAMESASERVTSDFELHSLLTTERYIGDEDRAGPYGVREWRDAFSPRQLVSHAEYLSAFEKVQPKIQKEYDNKTAEAILTLLALVSSKAVDRNIRFAPYDTGKGYPANAVGGKHFTLQWSFVDNNLSSGDQCYSDMLDRVVSSYEDLVSYVEHIDDPEITVLNEDATSLSVDDESIQAIIIDPPYYDSIIYSEMSDVFYVWLKEYLGEVYPGLFDSDLSNKDNEAVANITEFEDIAGGSTSKRELANQDYEEKMSNIFSELNRTLEPGGVMTVMFTHKETDAWDTLTMSLINSGFTITSTHPITSEMPQRTDTRSGGSAETTLLLTGRKPHEERNPENAVPTLWSDVEADTRDAAKEAARDLLESGVSLTKTDVIISAFGPTLRVFADAYPVVDDEDEEVPPRKALETAREAVTQILVDEYLEGMDVDTLDDVTEWYVLCWLVHESETFSYDDGRQLGLGIGVDIDEIKRSTKTWRKSRGDISLRGHDGRVQNINEKPEDRSSRLPIDPDDLSFPRSLDAVHAAMHVYDKKGETVTLEWLRERNYDTDSQFKATLKALLQVLPKNHEDWELARDLAVGRTSDVLDLDFGPNIFADDREDTSQQSLEEF